VVGCLGVDMNRNDGYTIVDMEGSDTPTGWMSQTEWQRIAVQRLGGRCRACNETNPLILTLDHIDNSGWRSETESQTKVYRDIAEGRRAGEFQVLCYNHNALKYKLLVGVDKRQVCSQDINTGMTNESYKVTI